MKLRDDWAAWAGLVAGYGLSLTGAVVAMAMGRDAAPSGAAPSGAAVFQRICADCHGEASGNPVVRLPRPFEYDDALVRATVRDGRGEMPAFSTGQISDAEIDSVAGFLRSEGPR